MMKPFSNPSSSYGISSGNTFHRCWHIWYDYPIGPIMDQSNARLINQYRMTSHFNLARNLETGVTCWMNNALPSKYYPVLPTKATDTLPGPNNLSYASPQSVKPLTTPTTIDESLTDICMDTHLSQRPYRYFSTRKSDVCTYDITKRVFGCVTNSCFWTDPWNRGVDKLRYETLVSQNQMTPINHLHSRSTPRQCSWIVSPILIITNE